MGKTTGISWTRSTWNPWIGCTEVSPGCDNCYARALDARFRYGGATHWGAGVPRHRTSEANWRAPLLWNKHAKEAGRRWTVFPSLCDPFDNEVPDEWRARFWELIHATPALTWLLLTKRIGNVTRMLPSWWDDDYGNVRRHVWIGVSIVNQEEANRDIPKLLAVPSAKRFVSYEPALGPIDFRPFFTEHRTIYFQAGTQGDLSGREIADIYYNGIDHIIVGGESSQGGVKARPFNLFWARSVISQCKAAGVPVFFKQAGSRPGWWEEGNIKILASFKDRAGADPSEWPEEFQVQQFPEGRP